MKVITKKHKIPYYTSKQFSYYYDDMKIGIFDIETLGLNSTLCPMILAGFMTFEEDDQCTIVQYFAENPGEEIEILNQLKLDFEKVDYIFTYNGKHFDIPFVEKRANLARINDINTFIHNLDLYLVLNGHSEIKHIVKNLKQKSIEEYMGLSDTRCDVISGAESIKLYEAYLNATKPDEKQLLEDKILLHNHDDLLQLYQLMPILKQVDIHKAFYSLGFPIKGRSGWPTLNITSLKVNSTELKISGKYYGEKFSYISYPTVRKHFSCKFNEDNTFEFEIHIMKHKGNTFINLPSFFRYYKRFKKYPNFVKDFLLISTSNSINHLEINAFTKEFIIKFMNDTICPLMVL